MAKASAVAEASNFANASMDRMADRETCPTTDRKGRSGSRESGRGDSHALAAPDFRVWRFAFFSILDVISGLINCVKG